MGGKQVITFLDGYATPLQCRSGLMYMNFLDKPTDADKAKYPSVILTEPHERDSSVFDYTHPTSSGDPVWVPDPSAQALHDPRLDECGHFKWRVLQTLSLLAEQPLVIHKHETKPAPIDFAKHHPYFCWVNQGTIEKTFKHRTQW